MRKTFRVFLLSILSALLLSACSGESSILNNVNTAETQSSDSESDDITVTPIVISEDDDIPEAENGVLYFRKPKSSGSRLERISSSAQGPFSIVDYSSSSFRNPFVIVSPESSSSEESSSSVVSISDPESSSGIIINVWDWSLPIEEYLNPDIVYESMVDDRDGQKYHIVKIANRWWMAQNLNYNGEEVEGENWCYGNSDQHCEVAGRLYTWDAATVACPEGWRLPYPAEWRVLISYSGGSQNAGRNLKSTVGWFSMDDKDGNGSDSLGFSAIPAGERTTDGKFDELGRNAYFWKNSASTNYGDFVSLYYADRVEESYHYKNMGFSVRCIEDLVY